MRKWLIVILILAIVGGGGYYVVFKTDFFRIQHIDFNPHEALNIYDLERYSGVHYDDFIFDVNAEDAREGLLTHPYVKSAEVEVALPDTVTFNITYRQHYMNIKYSDMILSLDESLMVLKVLDQEADGYTVEGMAFNAFSTGKQIEVNALYILENIVDLVDLLNVSEVNADKVIDYSKNNIVIHLGDIRVNFGDGENIEKRFNAFVNIYETLKTEGITSGVIDVSSDGLPVYRPFGE